jgi:hypothetical protein
MQGFYFGVKGLNIGFQFTEIVSPAFLSGASYLYDCGYRYCFVAL